MSIRKILCERSPGHPSYPSSTTNYSCYACLENQLCKQREVSERIKFVLPICIPHGEYLFTKGFGKCMFHEVLSQQISEMSPVSVLCLSRASSQVILVIHTLWHSAPGTRVPVPRGRTHTHHSHQLWAHGAAHPLLPYMGTYQNHRTQDTAA